MRKLTSLLCLSYLTCLPVSAEPGVAVLTDSKNAAVHSRAIEAQRCVKELRSRNKLDETTLPIILVDLSDPTKASYWAKEFEVRKNNLPALACIEKRGNKVAEIGTILNQFPNPMDASSTIFSALKKKMPEISAVKLTTCLDIQTVPDGAEVFIDGQSQGNTPLPEVEVPPGKPVRLELRHPACEPWSETVTLKPAQVKQLKRELTIGKGALKIDSNVKAEVFLDGQATAAGSTPMSLSQLVAGPHVLVCKANGCYAGTCSVDLTANKTTALSLTMEPVQTKFNIQVTGQGRHVSIQDDKRWLNNEYSNGMFGVDKIEKDLDVNSEPLKAFLIKNLQDSGSYVVLMGPGADYGLAASFSATDGGGMEATMSLLDSQGKLLGSETVNKGGGFFGNWTASSDGVRDLAQEAIREMLPKILAKVSPVDANTPRKCQHTVNVTD
jgi:hypothetical protein